MNNFFGCDTPEIADKIKECNFNIFLVTGWYLKSYWQAIQVCHRLGIPVMVRGDSQLVTKRHWSEKFAKRFLYKILMRQFDACLAVGERSMQYYLYYGVPANKIFRVPHFVDNEWFEKQTAIFYKDRDKLRNQLGVKDNARLILFVGKLIEKKRPFDLIQALSLLNKTGVETEGLFVGSGKLESSLRSMAENLNVRLHLVGFQNQSQMPKFYAVSDLLVLPSDGRETWGLVINEAMACGLPAVVSDAAGCSPDMINPGETGFTYPVGNIPKLAEQIEKGLSLRHSKIAEKALAQKMNDFSIENAILGLKKAMDSIS